MPYDVDIIITWKPYVIHKSSNATNGETKDPRDLNFP